MMKYSRSIHCILYLAFSAALFAQPEVTRLRTDYRDNPLGIDNSGAM